MGLDFCNELSRGDVQLRVYRTCEVGREAGRYGHAQEGAFSAVGWMVWACHRRLWSGFIEGCLEIVDEV